MSSTDSRLPLLGGRLSVDFANATPSNGTLSWERLILFLESTRIVSAERGAQLLSLPQSDPQAAEALLQKAWRLGTALRKVFDERAGAAVPREDPAQKIDAGKFIGDTIGRKASQVWISVVGKAALKIDGVINLMLFDEQTAIQRELADAVAGTK